MFKKIKNMPSGQNAYHYLGQTPMRVGVLPPQFCELESCHKFVIVVIMET